MNLYWQGKAPFTHKVKAPARKKPDTEGYEKFLGKVAWHSTRQAYRELVDRQRRESQ